MTITLDDLSQEAIIVCEDITDIPRLEWLKMRQTGLGGSDAAPAVGMSPWKSPVALYFDKTDPITADEDTELFKRGRQMEGPIADMFAEESNLEVVKLPVMLRSGMYEFMLANVDRYVVETDGTWAILECKNVGVNQTHDWDDGPPLHYRLQIQHYLAVHGPRFQRAYIAALIGGNKLVIFVVERDETLIADIIAGEEAFWTFVTLKRMPSIDGTDSTRAALAEHFAKPEVESKEVSREILTLIEQHRAAKVGLKLASDRVNEIESAMKALIGDAEEATVDGDVVATWKVVTKAEYVVKPQQYRQLSVKKMRETK